jgi:hypothetical protein
MAELEHGKSKIRGEAERFSSCGPEAEGYLQSYGWSREFDMGHGFDIGLAVLKFTL